MIWNLFRWPKDQPKRDRQAEPRGKPKGERTLLCAVSGESFRNEDGQSRQELIELLQIGEPVELRPEPDNPRDPDAIAVMTDVGKVGYVPSKADWVWQVMDEGRIKSARIAKITGGTGSKGHRGVVLEITLAGRTSGTSKL
ncbi:HIRAN domain-containing protein [Marinicauda algicola]|nr:HIRAN domain-containing protein [Marinicauda algicola]